MQYYIGIDGGGTKTALCKASVDNPMPSYAETGGTSWRDIGMDKTVERLKFAVKDLVKDDRGRIAGIALGLPCHGESAEGDRALEAAVKAEFSPAPVYITNDVEVGWAGSMALEPGINIVAGTGSIGFGKDRHGRTARGGGWSEFFGDEGSCYWIGRKIMELFSKQSDGRVPKDELYTTICRELNLENDFSFIDLMHSEYIGNRSKVAGLQILAGKAAAAGSPSVKALYREAACELLLIVNAIRDRLDFADDIWTVSYSGGLFKSEELILPLLSEKIEKAGGRMLPPRFAPVEGSVLLAFQHFCPDPGAAGKIQKILKESKTNSRRENNETDIRRNTRHI